MLSSIKIAWNNNELNEQDYNNLSDLLLIPICIFALLIIF